MVEILVQQNGINFTVDLNGDEALSINYEIADINDIGDTNGPYTKTINIPDTANNRLTFGFVTDLSADLDFNYNNGGQFPFNPNKKIKCFVLEDSIPILDGYIQVTNYTWDAVANNKVIQCVIYADNVNFWNSMGDSYITDIDFSELNFTYSIANIKKTWNNDPDAYKIGRYFPLIDYGNGWTLDDLNNNDTNKVGLTDFKPAIFVKTIWDKIFATNSYYYVSKFLGSSNKGSVVNPDPRFGNLVIPYNSQVFQTGADFNQDKIFHVGLTTSTLGQYCTQSLQTYVWPSLFPPTSGVLNIVGGTPANCWYDGFMLSPFQFDGARNSGLSSSTYIEDFINVPFGNTAAPMFNPVVNGQPIYDLDSLAYPFYQNTTASIYKQRFVFKTDIVTLYSNNGNYTQQHYFTPGFVGTGVTPPALKYFMWANFYREIDPMTGTTSPSWILGTGSLIPPDLGFQNSGKVFTIAESNDRFWICDHNGKSNVFDSNGTLIVPTGDSRYLGKYCTDFTGQYAISAGTPDTALDASSHSHFKNVSGNCKSFYFNDGFNSTSNGVWTSGDLSFYNTTVNVPQNGDWYQSLQMQSIYLDGNPLDPFYGDPAMGASYGVVEPKGNTPLFPGEKVRCVISFGGKYYGDQISTNAYMPPSAAFLLTYTNFSGEAPSPYGNYQNPPSLNKPLTTFFNDVSSDYIEGMTVNFNDVVPKNIKQRDFVLDIVNLHNLYIDPLKDNPNTLIIEPRDDYYQLATQSLDWTNKVDLTTPIQVQVLAETQNKTTLFTYKDDKDFYNNLYTQNTNEVYGQMLFSIDNDFLTDQKQIQSIFSPTPLVQLSSFFGDGGGDSLATFGGFIIPVITSGTNQKPTTNEPANGTPEYNYRILFKNYIENQNRDKIYLIDGFTHSYPYAGPYDDPYNPSYTTNWGQTLGEFFATDTTSFPANLVNTYWATLLTELTDMDSKIVTVSMYLTPQDINNFYFYKLVFLSLDGVDGYYKVNSIEDYIPGQNSVCTVTLLKSNVT